MAGIATIGILDAATSAHNLMLALQAEIKAAGISDKVAEAMPGLKAAYAQRNPNPETGQPDTYKAALNEAAQVVASGHGRVAAAFVQWVQFELGFVSERTGVATNAGATQARIRQARVSMGIDEESVKRRLEEAAAAKQRVAVR